MIDGLKVTMTGDELRTILKARVEAHRANAVRWKRDAERPPNEQTEDTPLVPEHICDNKAGRHEWRAGVLEFLRDHLEPLEICRLGESDLAFGDVLPAKPFWLEQDGYEQQHAGRFALERIARRGRFALERIAKRVCCAPEIFQITNPDFAQDREANESQ